MSRFVRHVRARAVAGILLILPVGVTLFVLQFFVRWVEAIFGQPIDKILYHVFHRDISIPGLGVLAFFIFLYVAGIIATNVVGRSFAYLTDRFFTTIPLARTIYVAAKQLTSALSTERIQTFRQTVFVEFPKSGTYTIGFATNEILDGQGRAFLSVFIPTTPNPTSGYMLVVPKDRAIPSSLKIDEAINSVISGGFALPPTVRASLSL